MENITRREMMLRAAAAGIGMAGCGLAGCSQPTQGQAERPEELPPAAKEARKNHQAMDKNLTAADNTFGIRLLQQLWKQQPDTNLFVSPLSLAMALQMTLNGARGKTQQVMQEALALNGMELETMNRANAALLARLSDLDPRIQLQIANGLWGEDVVNADFVRLNQTYYGAELGPLSDVPDRVNAWVKRKTNGKIESLFDSLPPNVTAILANAVYFKGVWTHSFDKAATGNGAFQLPDGSSLQIPLMTQKGRFPYYREEGFQAIRLPYGSGKMSFVVILPDENRPLNALLASLSAANWQKWQAAFVPQSGSIALPRFQLTYTARMDEPLKALGMGLAFEPGKADLSGIAPDVWIGMVQHKTFLDVNEAGAEAAAASGVAVITKSISHEFNMIVNRPFCCAIQDEQTGILLFLGAIVRPQQAA